MATLPPKRFACALSVGLVLVGVTLSSASTPGTSIQSAIASTGEAALDEPTPQPPPGPDVQRPGDPGTRQAAPQPHRRHVDNDPIFRR